MGFGRIVKAVSTGGLSEVLGSGSGKNLLFGKKDPGSPDRHVMLDKGLYDLTQSIRPQQQKAANIYGQAIDRIGGNTSEAMAKLALNNQLRGLGGIIGDKTRMAQEQIARRGLNRSSVGLNALINAGDKERQSMATARANLPMLEKQFEADRLNRLGQASRGLAGIIATPDRSRAFVQGQASRGRTGGLAGILGGAAGAYFGGPQGAMAGFNMGNSLGNLQLG